MTLSSKQGSRRRRSPALSRCPEPYTYPRRHSFSAFILNSRIMPNISFLKSVLLLCLHHRPYRKRRNRRPCWAHSLLHTDFISRHIILPPSDDTRCASTSMASIRSP